MTQEFSIIIFVRERPWTVGGAAFAFFILVLLYWIFWAPNTTSLASDRAVSVPRGATFASATDSLDLSGVLRTKWTFSLAGRILGVTTEIKVGKYLFPKGLSNLEILRDLAEGKSRVLIPVTIPEGWRIERMAIRYAQSLGIDAEKFISLCRSGRFTRSLGFDAESLEGFLLPETYKFFWQTDEEEIIRRMTEEFKVFYVDSLKARQMEVTMTLNQVLSLASIVEGETRIATERATIAGVYLNRLRKGMRLEADPTVQYVLPDGPRRLFYSDLRIDSPYNTYRYYGLPPGPVGNPGRQSILAVLYPEKHSFIFFVADGTGGHKFSRNYSDHRKAVQEFQRWRRENQKNSNTTG